MRGAGCFWCEAVRGPWGLRPVSGDRWVAVDGSWSRVPGSGRRWLVCRDVLGCWRRCQDRAAMRPDPADYTHRKRRKRQWPPRVPARAPGGVFIAAR